MVNCTLLFDVASDSGSDKDGATDATMAIDAGAPDANPNVACEIRRSGVAWWRGEDNANDSSEMEPLFDGENIGEVQFANGQVGKAFTFAGTNQRISVNDDGDTFLPIGSFSVELWVKVDKPQGVLVSKDNCGSANSCTIVGRYTWWNLYFNKGKLNFSMINLGGTPANLVGGELDLTEFHHIVAVRNVQEKRIVLYVDGMLKSEIAIDGKLLEELVDPNVGAEPVLLGGARSDQSTGPFFQGSLDEVVYYDQALTSDKVMMLYNKPCPPTR